MRKFLFIIFALVIAFCVSAFTLVGCDSQPAGDNGSSVQTPGDDTSGDNGEGSNDDDSQNGEENNGQGIINPPGKPNKEDSFEAN